MNQDRHAPDKNRRKNRIHGSSPLLEAGVLSYFLEGHNRDLVDQII